MLLVITGLALGPLAKTELRLFPSFSLGTEYLLIVEL